MSWKQQAARSLQIERASPAPRIRVIRRLEAVASTDAEPYHTEKALIERIMNPTWDRSPND